MKIVEIKPLNNNSHRNQIYHGVLPLGWAVIPDDLICDNFPFGEIIAKEVEGTMTVIEWIPKELPESINEQMNQNNIETDLISMVVDQEYQLTLLKLNLT